MMLFTHNVKKIEKTRKHSSRMRTDRAVTRSDGVANKDEQWPSIHEADCEQNQRRVIILPSLAVGNEITKNGDVDGTCKRALI